MSQTTLQPFQDFQSNNPLPLGIGSDLQSVAITNQRHQALKFNDPLPDKKRIYKVHKASALGSNLSTAAHRLRYDAILEAVKHMGADVSIREFKAHAVCSVSSQFMLVAPQAGGEIIVGLALPASTDERLSPIVKRLSNSAITSQFVLNVHEPIRGWQLGALRRAYTAAQ